MMVPLSQNFYSYFKDFHKNLISDINEVWGLEAGLILDGLYAGTADCIERTKVKNL